MSNSISFLIRMCLRQLDLLVTSQELERYESEVSPDLWSDELGRLRVWTANIGAHQIGQRSLDYRLREASHLKEQTLRVLRRLERTIEDLQSHLHGTGFHEELSSGSESDEEDKTELQQIYCSLQDTVNILFKTSMSIRRPAQHDRLLGVKRSDTAPFEPFDRQHVENKFPRLPAALIDRLGLAISQRRATLRYRERHHRKLAQGLDQFMDNGEDRLSTILSETIATEFHQQAAEDTLEIQSSLSQTSYAGTIMDGGQGIAVPPPPKDLMQCDSFECPYCFLIISVTNKSSWVKHVFHDLMPYICVFPDCRWPHRLYESRREWYAHLQIEHSIHEDWTTSINCPLCDETLGSEKSFEQHVGRHLQELALFALPKSGPDKDNESYTSTLSGGGRRHSEVDKSPMLDVSGWDDENDTSEPYPSTIPEGEQPEANMMSNQSNIPSQWDGTCYEKYFKSPILESKAQQGVHPVQQHEQDDNREQELEQKGKNRAEGLSEQLELINLDNPVEQKATLEVVREQKPNENEVQFDYHPPGDDVSGNQEIIRTFDTSNTEKPYPRKGRTRLPSRLVHIDAIVDLGYPFAETGDIVFILKALSKEQIDEVVSLSRYYKRAQHTSTGHFRRGRTKDEGGGHIRTPRKRAASEDDVRGRRMLDYETLDIEQEARLLQLERDGVIGITRKIDKPTDDEGSDDRRKKGPSSRLEVTRAMAL